MDLTDIISKLSSSCFVFTIHLIAFAKKSLDWTCFAFGIIIFPVSTNVANRSSSDFYRRDDKFSVISL